MDSLAADLRTMVRTPLAQAHVEAMRQVGHEVHFKARDVVVHAGTPMDHFYYMLEGEASVMHPEGDRYGTATMGPTQFVGEISFLNNSNTLLPIVALKDCTFLAVPRQEMLSLMSQIPEMSDIIVTVFAARRRALLENNASSLTLIGADQDRNIRQVAAFASRNRIPYRSLSLDCSEAHEVAQTCSLLKHGPAVIYGKDTVIEDPSLRNVAKVLGIDLEIDCSEILDVIIVGGGPAGIAAAVYAGSEGLSALVLEDLTIGGQAGTSSRIENYMGFPTGISGADLCWRGEVQAMKFGTKFAMPHRATALEVGEDGLFGVTLEDGLTVRGRAVVIATGVQYRRLPLERLSDFEGNGIYYAATDVEARYCRDAEVVVIGGGNSAGQAAMFLCRTAKHVHVLVRGTTLADSMSSYLSERLENDPSITIHYQCEVCQLHGEEGLGSVSIRNKASDEVWRNDACAMFVMIGAAPNTQWLSDHVALDERGFVLTGPDVGGRSTYETSLPGVFAVGDVRAGSTKRVASSVGEGSVVISKVWSHVNAQ